MKRILMGFALLLALAMLAGVGTPGLLGFQGQLAFSGPKLTFWDENQDMTDCLSPTPRGRSLVKTRTVINLTAEQEYLQIIQIERMNFSFYLHQLETNPVPYSALQTWHYVNANNPFDYYRPGSIVQRPFWSIVYFTNNKIICPTTKNCDAYVGVTGFRPTEARRALIQFQGIPPFSKGVCS